MNYVPSSKSIIGSYMEIVRKRNFPALLSKQQVSVLPWIYPCADMFCPSAHCNREQSLEKLPEAGCALRDSSRQERRITHQTASVGAGNEGGDSLTMPSYLISWGQRDNKIIFLKPFTVGSKSLGWEFPIFRPLLLGAVVVFQSGQRILSSCKFQCLNFSPLVTGWLAGSLAAD